VLLIDLLALAGRDLLSISQSNAAKSR
jgi:hypothetical protein